MLSESEKEEWQDLGKDHDSLRSEYYDLQIIIMNFNGIAGELDSICLPLFNRYKALWLIGFG